ncbi:unnamed protein product [Meloidogyne enterolobii]|uniref:Uncharacterized protein n=1 Tax=Meloidogyne enterolobii TaxID=390850 RepID=A0ACB0YAX9_MELEN
MSFTYIFAHQPFVIFTFPSPILQNFPPILFPPLFLLFSHICACISSFYCLF